MKKVWKIFAIALSLAAALCIVTLVFSALCLAGVSFGGGTTFVLWLGSVTAALFLGGAIAFLYLSLTRKPM